MVNDVSAAQFWYANQPMDVTESGTTTVGWHSDHGLDGGGGSDGGGGEVSGTGGGGDGVGGGGSGRQAPLAP